MLRIEARPANAWGYVCAWDVIRGYSVCALLLVVDGAFAGAGRPNYRCSDEFAATIPWAVCFYHANHAMQADDGRIYVPYVRQPLPETPPGYSAP